MPALGAGLGFVLSLSGLATNLILMYHFDHSVVFFFCISWMNSVVIRITADTFVTDYRWLLPLPGRRYEHGMGRVSMVNFHTVVADTNYN